jgi:hypothetical protein
MSSTSGKPHVPRQRSDKVRAFDIALLSIALSDID